MQRHLCSFKCVLSVHLLLLLFFFFRGLLYMCLCVYMYIGKYSVQQLVFSSSCLLKSGRFGVIFARKKQNCDVCGRPAIQDFAGFMISQKHYAQPLCTAFVKTKKKMCLDFCSPLLILCPKSWHAFPCKTKLQQRGPNKWFFSIPSKNSLKLHSHPSKNSSILHAEK